MALSEAKRIVLRSLGAILLSLGVILFSFGAGLFITGGCIGLSVDEDVPWVVRDYELGIEVTYSVNSRVMGVIGVLMGIVSELFAVVLTDGRVPFVILFGLSLFLTLLLFADRRGFVFAIEAGTIAAMTGAFYFLLAKKSGYYDRDRAC